jgi:hypothetical protein
MGFDRVQGRDPPSDAFAPRDGCAGLRLAIALRQNSTASSTSIRCGLIEQSLDAYVSDAVPAGTRLP